MNNELREKQNASEKDNGVSSNEKRSEKNESKKNQIN